MILKGLILGFSTGIFCLGYCYPILGPIMLSRDKKDIKNSSLSIALFLLGRLTAYIIFGLVFGIAGQYIVLLPIFNRIILPSLYIILGALMMLYGAMQSMPRWQICIITKKYFQDVKYLLLVGFLAGINICPPFLLAITTVISFGEVMKSVIFFIFFFLATSVYFLPFIFSGSISRSNDVQIAARITAVIAGIWFIYLAVRIL
jgi:sulfite exporter TauE/SafE